MKPRTANFEVQYPLNSASAMKPFKLEMFDDVPVTGGNQVREELFGAGDEAPEVDAQYSFVGRVVGVEDGGRCCRDAGVVVDLVDDPVVLGDGIGELPEAVAVTDVESCGMHLRSKRFHVLDGVGQRGVVDVGDRQAGPALGQSDCQCVPDS